MTAAQSKTHRRTAKTIRNLTRTMVHLRLRGAGDEDKPYRVELNPRGRIGDWETIPARLTEDSTFTTGAGRLFEIIPLSEAREIAYEGQGGPIGLPPARLVTIEESTIASAPNWDGEGLAPRTALVQHAGPRTVDAPGSDAALHAALAEGNQALPPGAFAPATVEKA